MALKILRASCDTNNPETGNPDWVNFIENANLPYNPKRLTVFVGNHKKGQRYDIMASSGGLLAPQHFTWENFPQQDKKRYYLLPRQASVTLEVHLEPTVGANLSTTNQFNGALPSDALAINLGTSYSNGTVEDFPNEDEWGKLVYYDTGRLGRGFAFQPNAYFPAVSSSGNQLGFFLMGGAIPDYTDQNIYVSLKNQTSGIRLTSALNFQVGRDLSLLNQMHDDGEIGISGYWSIGYESVQGNVIGNKDGRVDNYDTHVPTWLNFGLPTVGYPSAATVSGATVSYPDSYWQLVNPIYGKPCTQGNNRWGNCISITPSAFFTTAGYKLVTSIESNPTGANAVEKSKWTTYFNTSSSKIILKETQPLYMEAPIMNGKLPILSIPNVEAGLQMLVPITRIMNGVVLYSNYGDGNTTTPTMKLAHSSTSTGEEASNYSMPEQGLLYLNFNVTYVKMTINMPVERIDTESQSEKYFGVLSTTGGLTQNFKLWLRWYMEGEDKQLKSTITLKELTAQQINPNDYLEFRITAKMIILKLMEAMKLHNIPTTDLPLSGLKITDTIVSCTTKPDLYQLYNRLLNSNSFVQTPQGSILQAGGTKVFTRNGPNLSSSPPDPVTIYFYDVINGIGEIQNDGKRICSYESYPLLGLSRRNLTNDYYTKTRHDILKNAYPELRWPDLNNSSDDGGVVVVHCRTNHHFNYPWCGPSNTTISGGGIKIDGANSLTATSENFAKYEQGWFNNYNPFSSDFNETYNQPGTDPWEDLDSRLVDFNSRAVEVWIGLLVNLPIYDGNYLKNDNTVADNIKTNGFTSFNLLK